MKKLLILLFLAASLSASAQFCRKDTIKSFSVSATNVKTPIARTINYYKSPTNNQLDSTLYQEWAQGAWGNRNKTVYAYTNGLKTRELTSNFNQNAWLKLRKQNWMHDASGNVLVKADSNYIPASNNYLLNFTEVSTYNANNKLTQRISYALQSPIYKTTAVYNANNLVTFETFAESKDNGVTFVAKRESVYEYNASDKMTLNQTKNLNTTTNMLQFSAQTITEYDANNNVTALENQNYQSGNWVPFNRYTYVYNSDGQVTIQGFPGLSGNQWVNNSQVLNTYTNKLLTLKETQSWNIVSQNTWTTTNSSSYTYNQYKRPTVEVYSNFAGPMLGMVPQSKTTYLYNDSADWNEKLNQSYNPQNMQYVNQSKENRNLSAKGLVLQFSNFAWITQSNSWRPNSINNFTFSTTNKLTMQEDLVWDNGNNLLRPNQKRTFEFHPTFDYEIANTNQTGFNLGAGIYSNHIRIEFACVNSVTSSIKKTETANNGLKIYPNPNNSGTLNIENAANGIVSIYNTMGQKVMTQNMDEAKGSVNISPLDKGLYIVILKSNGAKQNTKLIVE